MMDDRDARPGVLFADMDLIGVPHRLVLSERGLSAGNAEYKGRADAQPVQVPLAQAAAYIAERLGGR